MRNLKGIRLFQGKPPNLLPFQVAVGEVVQAVGHDAKEVKVTRMELDEYLKMYFNKPYSVVTLDTKNQTKKGDIVLIKKLEKPPSLLKRFEIAEVLYKIDNIVDPITGKSVNHESEILKKYYEELSKENAKPKSD